MKEQYEYTIDDIPYTWHDFIKEGKALGFESDDSGITSTSEVANYLRRMGHKVGYFKDESQTKQPNGEGETLSQTKGVNDIKK